MKKTLSILLSFVLILSICACGKAEEAALILESDLNIGVIGEIALPEDIASVQSACVLGGNAFLACMTLEDTIILLKINLETGEFEMQETEIDTTVVLFPYEDEIRLLSGNPDTTMQTVGADLSLSEGTSLTALLGQFALVQAATTDADGNYYFLLNGTVIAADSNLKQLFEIKSTSKEKYYDIAATPEGEIFIAGRNLNDNSVSLHQIDTAKGEVMKDSITAGGNLISGNAAFDLYLNDSDGLFGIDAVSGLKTKLLNWFDRGIISSSIIDVFPLSDNCFAAITNTKLILLGETDEVLTSAAERTELTLACFGTDAYIQQMVMDYNSTNLEYYITILDYFPSDSADPYTEAQTKLTLEITAGQIPDMFYMVPVVWPIKDYSEKGVFENLYPYLDADADISRNDLFTSVLEASELDGALYNIPLTYQIEALMGRKSIFGDGELTLDAVMEYVQAHEGDLDFFCENLNFYQDNFITMMLASNGGAFVNRETGECYFESERFIEFLETAAMLPSNEYYSAFNDAMRQEDVHAWVNSLKQWDLGYAQVLNVLNYLNKSQYMGDDLAWYGFPIDGKDSEYYLDAISSVAISASGKHKDAAWDFIKQFLYNKETIDKINQGNDNGKLPINRAVFERLAEFWQSPDRGYEEFFGVDDISKYIDIEFFRDIIERANTLYVGSDEIAKIVEEVAESYFAGDKTAEEVASIIQSRVKILVAEQS